MKLHYNSPAILSFTLVCIFVLILDNFYPVVESLFTVYPVFSPSDPLWYPRLVTHAIGHQNWSHLAGNFAFILLIGPILEEKYGSKKLLIMMLITAGLTALLNILLFNTALLGASGIAFMLILLGSFTNYKSGHIPLTFVLILVMYLGKEVFDSFNSDRVSQFAHLIGGFCGGVFGFYFNRR